MRDNSAYRPIGANLTNTRRLVSNVQMQRLFQIAGWFVAFLIVILALVPPSLRPVTDRPHNLEHALIYLVTGASFEIGYPRRFFVNAIGLTAFAGAFELAKLWSSGRHARMSDFIVDALAHGCTDQCCNRESSCQLGAVHTWHIASIRCTAKFGRFQTIADIADFWREMGRSRLTHQRHGNRVGEGLMAGDQILEACYF
jgi:VanZ family protein